VQPATALAILPTTATTPAAQADNQAPSWAQQVMGKFSQGLTALNAAVSALRTPTTNQATTEPNVALDVTTGAGTTLSIHVLSDGNTITVADGAISVITPPATDSAAADDDVHEAITTLITAVTALASTMGTVLKQ
jgi:hypothetical protein